MRTKLVIGLTSAIVLAALAAAGAAYLLRATGGGADANDAQLVAEGRALYAEHCASCHGKNLEGQANWRQPLPTGGLAAPPHDETGHTWHHPDALLFDYTKKGGAALAPAGFKSNMPGFAETLSDHQIWAVLAFIKSTWPERIRARHEQINAQAR